VTTKNTDARQKNGHYEEKYMTAEQKKNEKCIQTEIEHQKQSKKKKKTKKKQ
jgi:hypothetical protein